MDSAPPSGTGRERTKFQREVCEMALAYTIESKVEAAYRRGDLFETRQELMSAWVNFCSRSTRRAYDV